MCEAHLSPAGGGVEGLPAVAVLQVHAAPALQQKLGRLDVAVSRRDVELMGGGERRALELLHMLRHKEL